MNVVTHYIILVRGQGDMCKHNVYGYTGESNTAKALLSFQGEIDNDTYLVWAKLIHKRTGKVVDCYPRGAIPFIKEQEDE